MADKKSNSPDLAKLAKELLEKHKLAPPPSISHERVSTGIPPLDWLLGGGIPLQAFTVLYGPKSSGKTTVAAHIAGQIQKQAGFVVWIDNEYSFSAEYFMKLGVNPSLIGYRAGLTIEEVFQLMSEFAKTTTQKEYRDVKLLFVWDSVATTPSAIEESAAFDQLTVGAGARALSAGFRKMSTYLINAPNAAYLIINQVRENMNAGWGMQEDGQYGGRALEHIAALQLHFSRKGTLKDVSGIRTRVTIKKSKVEDAPIFKYVDIVVRHGVGVDIPLTLFEIAKELKVITSAGGWWRWKDKSYRMSEILEKVIPDKEFQEKVKKAWEEQNLIQPA